MTERNTTSVQRWCQSVEEPGLHSGADWVSNIYERKNSKTKRGQQIPPFPCGQFFQVHGSKLKLHPVRYLGHASVLRITHRVFFLGVCEDPLNGFLSALIDLYVPLVLLSTFSVWKYAEKIHASHTAVKILSKHSMTIYFMHVLVLRIFRHFSMFERGMSGMLLLLATVFVCSLFVAIFWDNIIWKVKANKTTH